MNTLKYNYIFVDESGKPEVFSSKGVNLVQTGSASKYLVLSAVRTQNQLELQQKITEFRVSLLKNKSLTQFFSSAYTLDSFHAQVDYPEVKKLFYEFINTLDVLIDVIVVEKSKSFTVLQKNPGKLYGKMAGQLLKNLCHQSLSTEIIFSRKDSKLKLKQELESEVEKIRLDYLNLHPKLNSSLTLKYFHNPHYSHGGLQIADYVSYAVFQLFERNNTVWFELIQTKIGKIQDIFNKKYFTRSNPLKLST